MKEYFESDFFIALAGICSTIVAFSFAKFLGRAKLLRFMPPIIVSSLIIILAIENTSATYEGYAKGGDLIVYLLYPATVALAYPLYKNTKLIRLNALEVFCATLVSTFTSVFSIFVIASFMELGEDIINSISSKCVTTPVAIEISKMTGGILGITVASVFVSGIFGGTFGHGLLKMFGIKDDISIGLAIGSTSHVIGTAKCMQVSEKQAAMSALVLILTAVFTTFLLFILQT
ncbi:LrgB family protein [Intestinicryptomonas porci]|uniref:LrgB family protein n=1 Tax=Intestinicryptomonas porci TaxID=2926320 RepID=A0ABU4WIY6_9BACT|nr:LrgB family protein [Opitutales bacterium CLA-KB-P66]